MMVDCERAGLRVHGYFSRVIKNARLFQGTTLSIQPKNRQVGATQNGNEISYNALQWTQSARS